jgi:hypothetical protein
MSHEEIKRMAESVGLVGLSADGLDRLSILTLEARANLVRLPKLRKKRARKCIFRSTAHILTVKPET